MKSLEYLVIAVVSIVLSFLIPNNVVLSQEANNRSSEIPVFSIFQSRNPPTAANAIVVADGRSPELIAAKFVPSESSEGIWYVAATVKSPQTFKSLSYCFLIELENSRFVTPLRRIYESDPVLDEQEFSDEVKSLRESKLRLRAEVQSRDRILKKLREDVGSYADLGRILSLREERKNLENSIASFSQEEGILNEALKAFQEKRIPGSYRVYELSLLRSLSALNDASSKYKRQLATQKKTKSGSESVEN